MAAPEIRRTLHAYIDARAAVLRPKTIEKLTSALAIFGEFLSVEFPELAGTADLERRHVEAFMTWTSTRPVRGSHDHVRQVGPSTIAHAVITLRTFLDDIAACGWSQSPAAAAGVRHRHPSPARAAAPCAAAGRRWRVDGCRRRAR